MAFSNVNVIHADANAETGNYTRRFDVQRRDQGVVLLTVDRLDALINEEDTETVSSLDLAEATELGWALLNAAGVVDDDEMRLRLREI